MTAEQHEQQARQFAGWHGKRGGDWLESFAVWAESKDFAPSDLLAIRRAAHEVLTSREAVITDLLDWMRSA